MSANVEIINNSSERIPLPSDGVLEPFEIGEVPKGWLHHRTTHRIKSLPDYDRMLDGLELRNLRAHAEKRSGYTDEDLAVQCQARTSDDESCTRAADEGVYCFQHDEHDDPESETARQRAEEQLREQLYVHDEAEEAA